MPVEHPYRGLVEIRIHGVSGTPPEELLDRSAVRQVAGDAIGGFYRPVLEEQLRDRTPGSESDSGPWLEGYSWGGWTSGARSRALWLILLPFALVNVAPRMIPPTTPARGGGEPRVNVLHRMIGALIRLLALTQTVTVTFGVSQVAFVAVARRCSAFPVGNPNPGTQCYGLPVVVSNWLGELPARWQVGVCALIPFAAVGIFWKLSTTATRRYEDVDPDAEGRNTDVRPDDDPNPLRRRDLWRGSRRVRRLRLLHVQAGFVTICALLAVVSPASGLRLVVIVAAAVTVGVCAVLVACRPANNSKHLMLSSRLNWILVLATVAAALALLIVNPGDRTGALQPDAMVRDLDVFYQWWFGIQAVILAMVLVALIALRTTIPGTAPVMHLGGMGAVVFAFLGWLVGLMFNAALLILAPTWLFTKGFVFGPGAITDFLNSHGEWFGTTTLSTGYGMLAALALIVAMVLIFVVFTVGRAFTGWARPDRDYLDEDYGDVVTDLPAPHRSFLAGIIGNIKRYWTEEVTTDEQRSQEQRRSRIKKILFIFWTARRIDYVAKAVGVFGGAMAIFIIVQVIGSGKGFLAVRPQDVGTDRIHTTVVAWGAYATVAGLFGALILGIASYRAVKTRKGVGILWDLTCFWPRDVHPFSPPCYTERIVPEVSRRMKAYLSAGPGGEAKQAPALILAAHSQGTVISAAVLLAQPAEFPKNRVTLLTFGTVLDRLYARFFPRYFSPTVFREIADMLRKDGKDAATDPSGMVSGWINLYRHSDYLGGALPYATGRALGRGADRADAQATGSTALVDPEGLDGPENVRLVDPEFFNSGDDIIDPPAGRHSNYWRDPTFQAKVAELGGRIDPELVSGALRSPDTMGFPEDPTTVR